MEREMGVADDRHTAAFVVGAILGGVVGAAITLWNAPQSGAATRAMIAEQAEGLLFRLAGMTEWQPEATASVAQEAAGGPPEQPALAHAEPPPAPAPIPDVAPPAEDGGAPLPATFLGTPVEERSADVVLEDAGPTPPDR